MTIQLMNLKICNNENERNGKLKVNSDVPDYIKSVHSIGYKFDVCQFDIHMRRMSYMLQRYNEIGDWKKNGKYIDMW